MYVHVTASETCVAQAERCAEHVEAAATDPQRLLDAVRCGHLGIMAGLAEALSGSAGVGAFPDKLAAEHLEFMRGQREAMPAEFTLPFSDLVKRAQDPARMEYGAIRLTTEEQHAAAEIDRLRTLIDHPKPTSWSIEAAIVVRVLEHVPDLLAKCIAAAPQRYAGLETGVRSSMDRIRSGLQRLSI